MADYAGLLGKTFDIPAQQSAPSGIDPYVLQQMQQIQQPGPALRKPEEGLYEVEGLTKEYYDKWAALNEFAQNMHGQGIDITKPDPFNPQSQAAHRWYLKAVADLERHGNSLKNSQKALESYTTAKLSDRGADIGLVDSFNVNRDLMSSFDIVNRGQTDLSNRVNTDLAKSSNDPREVTALNRQIDEKKRLLQTQLTDMIIGGATEAQVAEKINEINSLQRATYNDTTRWQEEQQNARDAKKEEEPTDFTRVELVQRVLNGDYQLLKANPKIKGVQLINTPRRKGIMVEAQGLEQAKFIDLSDPTSPAVLNEVNEMLNFGQEGKAVSIDDFTRLLKQYPNKIVTPALDDSKPAEEQFIDVLTIPGRFRMKEAAQVVLRKARPNLQIPTTVSGEDFAFFVDDIEFGDKGKLTIKLAAEGDKNPKESELVLDLNREADRDKFYEIIDANAKHLDYSSFKPKAPVPNTGIQTILPFGLKKDGMNVDNTSKLIDLL